MSVHQLGLVQALEGLLVGPVAGTSGIKKLTRYQPSLNPVSVAAATSAEQNFTVTGLAVGDIPLAFVNPTAYTAGVAFGGMRVSAADTLAVTFINATAAGVDPGGAETYEIWVLTPGAA